MTNHSDKITKELLYKEICSVEKILQAAQSPDRLREASELADSFMQSKPSNTFSSIEISEYIGYLHDAERKRQSQDNEAARDSLYNAHHSLKEINSEVRAAKQILATLTD